MRIGGRWSSGNVRDRRGVRAGVAGGGIGVLVLTLLALALGVDPSAVLQGGGAPEAAREAAPAQGDADAQFVTRVLGTTEAVWSEVFSEQLGRDYREPTLVLFSGAVQSACGFAGAAMGPFYCPPDHQVYIDLAFYDELSRRLGAGGDFAQAYVIAHEVGHHVQTLLGISDEVHSRRQSLGEADANALSVRQELQADCSAGVWANRVGSLPEVVIEPGDIQEAITAAGAIGDDRLQSRSQGQVVPESFTHGTSEQRIRWFRSGYDSGEPGACDTFAAREI